MTIYHQWPSTSPHLNPGCLAQLRTNPTDRILKLDAVRPFMNLLAEPQMLSMLRASPCGYMEQLPQESLEDIHPEIRKSPFNDPDNPWQLHERFFSSEIMQNSMWRKTMEAATTGWNYEDAQNENIEDTSPGGSLLLRPDKKFEAGLQRFLEMKHHKIQTSARKLFLGMDANLKDATPQLLRDSVALAKMLTYRDSMPIFLVTDDNKDLIAPYSPLALYHLLRQIQKPVSRPPYYLGAIWTITAKGGL